MTAHLPSFAGKWIRCRLLSLSLSTTGTGSDLVGMSVIPKKLRMPLTRHGVDPVPELGRRLEAMSPRIEGIVHERLDAMAAAGGVVDFVCEFAFPVPFLVICELLGLPVEDRGQFRQLGRARFDIATGGARPASARCRNLANSCCTRSPSSVGPPETGCLAR